MKTSNIGRELITEFESVRLKAYRCSAHVLTVGVGHTSAAGAPVVTPGMTITRVEADAILARDLAKFECAVDRLVTVPLTQNQFDALVSFTFNVGEGALSGSTLLRRLNAGDYQGAADAFAAWNKVGKKAVAGLTRRRAAEAELFRSAATRVIPSVVATAPIVASSAPPNPGLLTALLSLFRKAR